MCPSPSPVRFIGDRQHARTRTRVDREPKLTAAKIDTSSDNDDASDNSGSQADSGDHSDSDSDNDTGGQSAKITSATVRIGPPSRAKRTQPSEPITATADASDDSILDVKMHSPPHGQSSQHGQARNVKAIGSSSGSQLVRSSGASKPYGATIHGKALGNAPNIGDFDPAGDDISIDIEGTVNLFPSNTRPTTIDIDEAAVIAVTIPFEGALAPLLQHVAKYYSPMSETQMDSQGCTNPFAIISRVILHKVKSTRFWVTQILEIFDFLDLGSKGTFRGPVTCHIQHEFGCLDSVFGDLLDERAKHSHEGHDPVTHMVTLSQLANYRWTFETCSKQDLASSLHPDENAPLQIQRLVLQRRGR
ncbi:uncharacterized protein LACBIDRAFT_323909 [Laccaria bicolor S238N-H82]|uniref:Predicted protein n=1 Tax=Laccaria bicolor (strain S238N-H82 / ATCC MYA-4686) TaxID=486041 RepID=B0D015_LACBS|nr:uncharacterized protein LACBIDRAFT_323909 [Laccaria bicolor S238N-H82]EDR11747.1 predicted protein [Laccaria bicolor S238N-H82]|eukprot:XP_001877644.1 predicted protein [Laccaria bicolor S238N-H82]